MIQNYDSYYPKGIDGSENKIKRERKNSAFKYTLFS